MAFIESHQPLGNHPKTKRLARALDAERVQIVGHLHFLWWWALEYAEDGDLSGFTDAEIAEEAMWQGEPARFVAALQAAGFLEMDMRLHDWEHYTGRLVAQRESNRERQRRWRERRKADDGAESGAETVTPTPPDESITVTSPLRNATTVHNRTVPNQTVPETGANAPPTPPDGTPVRPAPKPRSVQSAIPADWQPSAESKRWAEETWPSAFVAAETEKMVDHFRGTGGKKADWDATWRNWLRRAGENGPRGPTPIRGKGHERTTADDARRIAAELRARGH